MNFPWHTKPSVKKMVKEEIWELVDVMRTHSPDSPEYKRAFALYSNFHEMEIKEKKLKEHRFGRIADIAGSGILAVIILTHEYWTPMTSNLERNMFRPFNHNDNDLLG